MNRCCATFYEDQDGSCRGKTINTVNLNRFTLLSCIALIHLKFKIKMLAWYIWTELYRDLCPTVLWETMPKQV